MTVTPQRWVCPRCQANNMLGVSRCFRCGSDRPAVPGGSPAAGGQPTSRGAPLPRPAPAPPVTARPAATPAIATHPSPPGTPVAQRTPWAKRNAVSLAIAAVVGAAIALVLVPSIFGRRGGSHNGSAGTRSTTGTPSIFSSPLATPTGEPSVTSSSGWKETPIREEKPVIHVDNRVPEDEEAATLVLQSETGRYELKLTPPSAELALPADNYRYWLYGQAFRHTGEPDQYGNLVCRKHRLYSLVLTWRRPGQRPDEDLGD